MTITLPLTGDGSCPPKWEHYGNKCFLNKNFPTRATNLDKAREQCQLVGGTLAPVTAAFNFAKNKSINLNFKVNVSIVGGDVRG